MGIESRVRDILEDEPGRSSTVDRLYRLLADDVGPDAPGYRRLRETIRSRPDTFDMLEAASPFQAEAAGALPASYEQALQQLGARPAARVAIAVRDGPSAHGAEVGTRGHGSGIGVCVRVGRSSSEPPQPGIEVTFRLADASLLDLYRQSRADPLVRGEISQGVNQVDELRRRTGCSS